MFVPKKKRGIENVCWLQKKNAVTVKNKYPLLLMADMKTKFRDARYFTILDLRNAFNFIKVKQKNEWKTVFRTKYGTSEYLIIPFGLTSASATIQKMFNKTLQSYLDRFAITYMDEILVYSDTHDQHIRHVKMVLDTLKQRNLKIKTEKCRFHVKGNNVFGICHYPRKHPDGNDKNGQYPNLASPQKHKGFAKVVGIHKILPKHDTKIRRMNIINDRFFAKKQFFWMGTRSDAKIGKIEKTFRHQQTINNTWSKKTNKIINRRFR